MGGGPQGPSPGTKGPREGVWLRLGGQGCPACISRDRDQVQRQQDHLRGATVFVL